MPSKCTHQESLTTIRICLELTAFVIVFAVVSKFWFGLDKKLLFDDVTKLIALSIFNSTQKNTRQYSKQKPIYNSYIDLMLHRIAIFILWRVRI